MDSVNNNDRKYNLPEDQGWDDAAFGWDNMKEGIFEKILAEDPQFFEENPKRRTAVWWWVGMGALVLAGLVFWLTGNQSPSPVENAPAPSFPKKPVEATAPIAEETGTFHSEKPITNEPSPTAASQTVAATRGNVVVNKSAGLSTPFETGSVNNGGQPFSKTTTKQAFDNETTDRSNVAKSTVPNAISLLAISPFETTQKETLQLRLLPMGGSKKGDNDVPEKGQWKLVAIGGGLFSSAKYGGSSEAAGLRNGHNTPYFGHQFGLEAWMPLGKNDYLLGGLAHQTVYQYLDIQTEQSFDTTLQNVHLQTVHSVVGNQTKDIYGDTLVSAVRRSRLAQYNEFSSVQFRAGYGRVFQKNKWQFAPFAAIAADWQTGSNGRTISGDQSIFAFDKNDPITKRIQLSAQAGMAVERELGDQLSVMLQYRFGQSLGNVSEEQGLELRPAFHAVALGVVKKW